MIVDLFAHLGPWPHRPIGVEARALAEMLAAWDVSVAYCGRLEALWFENPHDANRIAPEHANRDAWPEGFTIVPVPVLDPTIATWREELDRLVKNGPVPIIRLYPGYGSFSLAEAGALLDALATRKIIAQVVLHMEDVRRQHKLAQVPDVPLGAVAEAAAKHPGLTVLASGAQTPELRAMAARASEVRNLWVDTSNADGCGAVAGLLNTAWRDRLVFGSHAPLFIVYSAFARVVLDLDDEAARRVLEGNPADLLRAANGR